MSPEYTSTPLHRLTLANGDCWSIGCTPDARKYLDTLATVMTLDSISGAESVRMTLAGPNWLPEDREEWTYFDYLWCHIWERRTKDEVVCALRLQDKDIDDLVCIWNALNPIYRRVEKRGGLPMHAALIALDGKGVLIAAPGDGGKSTTARRMPSPWRALCDDEALVVKSDAGYLVHPFPTWSNFFYEDRSPRSWKVEEHVELAAIFFLEHSPVNEITPIGNGEAAVKIFESARDVSLRGAARLDRTFKSARRLDLFTNAGIIAENVPTFGLRASLTGEFWREIESVLELTATKV